MSDVRDITAADGGGKWPILLLFAAAGVLALFLALQVSDASLRDGVYHPVSNDAFYHARRIIDTAGERGFYEFDETIHVPEGSQITWPWAYDYLLGQALGIYLAINPGAAPMNFLAFVPPLWLLINVALFVAITGAAGLPFGLRAVAALGYAMFPMNQLIHGVGAIDHHYVEHTFVLLAVLMSLRWIARSGNRLNAAALGLVLGSATAFHNGLFILQLPLLIGAGALWLRGQSPDPRGTLTLAITLTATTLLTALPSLPLRQFAFDYGVLSWFHVYVSFCSSLMLVFLSRSRFDRRHLVTAAGIAIALSLPILFASAGGIAFLSGDIALHDRIEEAQSPIRKLLEDGGFRRVSLLYSALIVVAPLFALWFAWRALSERDPVQVMLAAAAAFGLLLLCTQIRLQYFGSFALLLAVPMMLHRYLPVLRQRTLVACMLGLLVISVAWQRPLAHQLFARHNLSFSIDYELAIDMFAPLRQVCAEQPGLVLASNNFGHPVRYHSDCSVLANNFLLTRQHEEKIAELQAAWALTPAQLVQQMPQVSYVLVSLSDIYLYTDTGLREPSRSELAASNPPLAMALTFDRDLPAAYELIDERLLDDGRDFAVARLFRIHSNNEGTASSGDD